MIDAYSEVDNEFPIRAARPCISHANFMTAEAIRLYTINDAYLTFEKKEKGSLEKGKLADFIVLDKHILSCPIDEVKDIQVEQTYVGGKLV